MNTNNLLQIIAAQINVLLNDYRAVLHTFYFTPRDPDEELFEASDKLKEQTRNIEVQLAELVPVGFRQLGQPVCRYVTGEDSRELAHEFLERLALQTRQ